MIQYPRGKKTVQKPTVSTNNRNRGIQLEDDINRSNDYYRQKKIAVVSKKPTPIQVVNVDYPSRNKVKITEAYYRQSSTTDYNGVYNGYALDFEAKETRNKTSFPLSSIHEHQILHLASVLEQKAIAFVIVRFVVYDETYLVYAKDFINFINTQTRKSIPHTWFKENGHLIKITYQVPCDYISVIKEHLSEEIK